MTTGLYYGGEKSMFNLRISSPQSGFIADVHTAVQLDYKQLYRNTAQLRLTYCAVSISDCGICWEMINFLHRQHLFFGFLDLKMNTESFKNALRQYVLSKIYP